MSGNDFISNGSVTFQAFPVHIVADRFMNVNVIIDAHIFLSFVFAVQSASILGNKTFP